MRRTELIKSGDLKVDQCLKVRGLAKEGYAGTEVSLGRSGGIEEVDLDIKPRIEPYKIAEIKRDMGDVSLLAVVVDPGEIREFVRKDGGKGQVRGRCSWEMRRARSGLPSGMSRPRCRSQKDETIEVINGSSPGEVRICWRSRRAAYSRPKEQPEAWTSLRR